MDGWMDGWFDPDLRLVRDPRGGASALVRESAWYAVGLQMRGRTKRAASIVRAVCARQWRRPGAPYDGTFARTVDESEPTSGDPRMWIDYDPNWRQFVGNALLDALDAGVGPASLIEDVVATAVAGEPGGRITPAYTNIALLHAAMLVRAGECIGVREWIAEGTRLCLEVERLFLESDKAFHEYNSPTYYGVDLMALTRLRHVETQDARQAATRLEAAVWESVMDMYAPQMWNLCGPYDRAYGMDMRRYVALLGLYLAEAGLAPAPLPPLDAPFGHAHDLFFRPLVAFRPSRPAVAPREDARVVERRFDGRTYTARITERVMWGGRAGGREGGDQAHPATVHWLHEGQVHWIRARAPQPFDAFADEDGLRFEGCRDATLDADVGTAPARGIWRLPGLDAGVEYDHGGRLAAVRLEGRRAARGNPHG